MNGVPPDFVVDTVDRLDWPTISQRAAWLGRTGDPAAHADLLGAIEALHRIEARLPPAGTPSPAPAGTARLLFWNVERLARPEGIARLIAAAGADPCLLAEVDLGMARSGNRHTIGELAARLDAGYAFGVEYVELGPGNARERPRVGDRPDLGGLHGNAILSRRPLRRLAMLRLERNGDWFDGSRGEPRIGGRMALFAQIELAGRPVTCITTHFESHTDPADRARQMRTLLDAIERYDADAPVIIGGDFNTSTFSLAERRDAALVEAALAAEPLRLVDPVAHEPLFALAAERGFTWKGCNLPGASTQRPWPDEPPRPLGRIDWFFARGLVCSDPAVLPAIGAEGETLSDHEAIAVTVAVYD